MQHPFAAEQEVRDRQEALLALAQSAHAARRVRAQRGSPLDRGRRALGRALVTLGVTVGLPRDRRRPAVENAVALLDPCAGAT